jgi:YidC/Oxa1 family membrane protein insertase
MTRSASAPSTWPVDLRRLPWLRIAQVALLVLVVLVVAGCAANGAPGASGASPTPTHSPAPPLEPAKPGDPVSTLAWLFTPIFQAMFIVLVAVYDFFSAIGAPAAIAWAIIALTLLVRTLVIPLYRRQLVSQRRMQLLQPEIKEIQRRYKGDRLKQNQAQAELMKARGTSQSGCLMAFLPFLLILPMYQVVREGLTSTDITPMLTVFGLKLIPITCDLYSGHPCLNSTIPWLGGVDAASYQTIGIPLPLIGTFGLSLYAVFYTVIQLIASRLALPKHDPNVQLDQSAQSQRTMSLVFPFITLLYGNIIPVGLFLYLIVSTAYQAVQQFLTTGWGSLFPLFGWTPGFAVDHKPRFPVPSVAASTSTTREAGAPARPKESPKPSSLDRSASANATIRQRGRQGRRGRRR